MMDAEDIREALLNVADIREDQMMPYARRSASPRDVDMTRRAFTRFLELLDGDLTVADIRDALEGRHG